jgi:hypothetical protein
MRVSMCERESVCEVLLLLATVGSQLCMQLPVAYQKKECKPLLQLLLLPLARLRLAAVCCCCITMPAATAAATAAAASVESTHHQLLLPLVGQKKKRCLTTNTI